jgi:hypothetical protein
MFWSKTKKEELVFCEVCGVAIKPDNSFKVKSLLYEFITNKFNINVKVQEKCKTLHYCSLHAKPYDEQEFDKFYKKFEVDRQGNILKNKGR